MPKDIAITDDGDLFFTNDGQTIDCENYPADQLYYDPRWRNLVQNIFIALQTLIGEWPSSSKIGHNLEDLIGSTYTYDVHKEITNSIRLAINNILPAGAYLDLSAAPTSGSACNITIKIVVNNTRIVAMQFPFSLVDGLIITGTGSSLFTHGDT